MDVSTAISGASFFYQVVKDLFKGGESRDIKLFSAQQIDLTIAEVKRQLDCRREDVQRQARSKQGKWKVQFGERGIEPTKGSALAIIRQEEAQAERVIGELKAQGDFVIQLLELEKAKLS